MEIEFGPAMRALTEKQRRFVQAMASDPFGSAADWARAAGYSDKSEAAKVSAHRLVHDPAIEAAVSEFARGCLTTVGPILAAVGLLRVASNPDHPKYLRAVEMLANRVGLHETHHVAVHHTGSDDVLDRIVGLAKRLGLDPGPLLGVNERPMKMIEGSVADGAGSERRADHPGDFVAEHAAAAGREEP